MKLTCVQTVKANIAPLRRFFEKARHLCHAIDVCFPQFINALRRFRFVLPLVVTTLVIVLALGFGGAGVGDVECGSLVIQFLKIRIKFREAVEC